MFCMITEKMRIQTVCLRQSLEMNLRRPYFSQSRAQHLDGVGLRVVFGGRGVQNRTGHDRAKAWFTLLALLYGFLIV